MNVTRDVILDLLPVYLAGEASEDTRRLVNEFVQADPSLGQELRQRTVENLAAIAPPSLPPDLELQALRSTRRVLAWQRRVLGAAVMFSLLPFSAGFRISGGRVVDAWLLARDYPQVAVLCVLIAVALWTTYAAARRRARTLV